MKSFCWIIIANACFRSSWFILSRWESHGNVLFSLWLLSASSLLNPSSIHIHKMSANKLLWTDKICHNKFALVNDAAEEYSDSGAIRRNQTHNINFLAIAMTFTILTAETIKFKVWRYKFQEENTLWLWCHFHRWAIKFKVFSPKRNVIRQNYIVIENKLCYEGMLQFVLFVDVCWHAWRTSQKRVRRFLRTRLVTMNGRRHKQFLMSLCVPSQ